jgi:hypothetical protein
MSCLLLFEGAPKGNKMTENTDRSASLASIASSDFTEYSSMDIILHSAILVFVALRTLFTYASTAPPTVELNFESLRPVSFADETKSPNEEDRISLLGRSDTFT